eukprot:gnl/Chilomastix_cuspidata/3550.p1 GENE.gnl/Chilomastix_cuspidata/3550~~gnl/Chilomastix_cuspidata/3550.p1  ORF type:complete len:1274 (-),score=374.76 gnl/Chilomastix_cuspidata/3550:97-3918(-)
MPKRDRSRKASPSAEQVFEQGRALLISPALKEPRNVPSLSDVFLFLVCYPRAIVPFNELAELLGIHASAAEEDALTACYVALSEIQLEWVFQFRWPIRLNLDALASASPTRVAPFHCDDRFVQFCLARGLDAQLLDAFTGLFTDRADGLLVPPPSAPLLFLRLGPVLMHALARNSPGATHEPSWPALLANRFRPLRCIAAAVEAVLASPLARNLQLRTVVQELAAGAAALFSMVPCVPARLRPDDSLTLFVAALFASSEAVGSVICRFLCACAFVDEVTPAELGMNILGNGAFQPAPVVVLALQAARLVSAVLCSMPTSDHGAAADFFQNALTEALFDPRNPQCNLLDALDRLARFCAAASEHPVLPRQRVTPEDAPEIARFHRQCRHSLKYAEFYLMCTAFPSKPVSPAQVPVCDLRPSLHLLGTHLRGASFLPPLGKFERSLTAFLFKAGMLMSYEITTGLLDAFLSALAGTERDGTVIPVALWNRRDARSCTVVADVPKTLQKQAEVVVVGMRRLGSDEGTRARWTLDALEVAVFVPKGGKFSLIDLPVEQFDTGERARQYVFFPHPSLGVHLSACFAFPKLLNAKLTRALTIPRDFRQFFLRCAFAPPQKGDTVPLFSLNPRVGVGLAAPLQRMFAIAGQLREVAGNMQRITLEWRAGADTGPQYRLSQGPLPATVVSDGSMSPFVPSSHQAALTFLLFFSRATAVVGAPGTGKTQGVANAVKELLTNTNSLFTRSVALQLPPARAQEPPALPPDAPCKLRGILVSPAGLADDGATPPHEFFRSSLMTSRGYHLCSFSNKNLPYVVATAPSNVAVDRLVEAFCEVAPFPLIVRLGMQGGAHTPLQVFHCMLSEVQGDVRQRLEAASCSSARPQLEKLLGLLAELQKPTFPAPARVKAAYAALKREYSALPGASFIANFLQKCLRGPGGFTDFLMQNAAVIAGTVDGLVRRAVDGSLPNRRVEALVVEEAGRVAEPPFLPLLFILSPARLLLVGDTYQMPPLIRDSSLAAGANMRQSILERFQRASFTFPAISGTHPEVSMALGAPTVLLNKQGRSHPSICALWADTYRGMGRIRSLPATFARAPIRELGAEHVYVVQSGSPTYKRSSMPEANLVLSLAGALLRAETPAMSLFVLTPYRDQKELLVAKTSKPKTSRGVPTDAIMTIDESQGKQADVVIISLVKANKFTCDANRALVALSRARRVLVVFMPAQSDVGQRGFPIASLAGAPRLTVASVKALWRAAKAAPNPAAEARKVDDLAVAFERGVSLK